MTLKPKNLILFLQNHTDIHTNINFVFTKYIIDYNHSLPTECSKYINRKMDKNQHKG